MAHEIPPPHPPLSRRPLPGGARRSSEARVRDDEAPSPLPYRGDDGVEIFGYATTACAVLALRVVMRKVTMNVADISNTMVGAGAESMKKLA